MGRGFGHNYTTRGKTQRRRAAWPPLAGIARTVTGRLGGDDVAHAQAKATQHEGVGGNASGQVGATVPGRGGSACVASSVVQGLLELVRGRGRNPRQLSLQRVVGGCGGQWEKFVALALRGPKGGPQI